MNIRTLCSAFLIFSAVAMTPSVSMAADAPGKNEANISAKLQHLAKTWADKSPEDIVKSMYVDETEITGEGVPELYTGHQALVGLVGHLMEISKSTTIDLNRFRQLTDDVAYTWVTWNVTPADSSAPFQMKSLFVWKKTGNDWRIVADMFANGAMPK
jgi:hypothetical protein